MKTQNLKLSANIFNFSVPVNNPLTLALHVHCIQILCKTTKIDVKYIFKSEHINDVILEILKS